MWEHKEQSRTAVKEAYGRTSCLFCARPLTVIHSMCEDAPCVGPGVQEAHCSFEIKRCAKCGWWTAKKHESDRGQSHGTPVSSYRIMASAGCLRVLDVSDISEPVQYIRDYLVGRYHERFKVHPRKFEEVVASVFRDLGFHALVTNYSGDDGIDIILNDADTTIGVQVKRYKGAIEVCQIRELAGALLLNGITKGVFVTTSSFQSGVPRTSAKLADRRYAIELMDSAAFYSALEIAQIRHHDRYDHTLLSYAFTDMTEVERDFYRYIPKPGDPPSFSWADLESGRVERFRHRSSNMHNLANSADAKKKPRG